ncbi:MAG: B12-binding domain-containing radical SAM protein [Candidatus Shapirobacteria bacterium]|nr:B12-binding domain-containing radical SAM protein [Candidatus Shapirobacteria bacterium]MDD4410529.1 B12-binding domain-containing radical SAM protein [Candidatus Shapirobacteria bacterium]
MNRKEKKIKLLLVNCEKVWNNIPHFGLMCLGSCIKEKYPFVDIKIIEDSKPLKKIIKYHPNIVGFTVDSVNYDFTKSIAKKVKQSIKTKIIIGGTHITGCPDSFDKVFDVGVIGEGEITLGEIIEAYKNDKKNNIKNSKIDGLVYFEKNKLIKTKPRKLIQNIDQLPIPSREFVPMEKKYLSRQLNLYGMKRLTGMMTSRGCPYHCLHCASNVQWGSVRFHSVEYIIKEIDYLIKNYDIDGLYFFDDFFTAPKARLIHLANEIKKRGWHKKIVFSGFGKADLIDEDVVKALKSMNVKRISFGFESFSSKMLNYLKANSVSVEQNIKAIDLCHKYGIGVSSGFIVTIPGETIEDLQATYQLLKKHPIENPNIYILIAYPGTKIWDYALEKGLVSKNMNVDNLFTEIPLKACFEFWKKDRFYFLEDRVFLNPEKRHDQKYLSMILKIKLLITWLNFKFYFKYVLLNPIYIYKVLKEKKSPALKILFFGKGKNNQKKK